MTHSTSQLQIQAQAQPSAVTSGYAQIGPFSGGCVPVDYAHRCSCDRYCPCCGKPRDTYQPIPYYAPPSSWPTVPYSYLTTAGAPNGAAHNNTLH